MLRIERRARSQFFRTYICTYIRLYVICRGGVIGERDSFNHIVTKLDGVCGLSCKFAEGVVPCIEASTRAALIVPCFVMAKTECGVSRGVARFFASNKSLFVNSVRLRLRFVDEVGKRIGDSSGNNGVPL